MGESTPAVPLSWLGGGVHVDVLAGVALLGVAYVWAWLRHGGRPTGGPSFNRRNEPAFFVLFAKAPVNASVVSIATTIFA